MGERIARIVADIETDIAHVHCVQDLGARLPDALKNAGCGVLSVHDFWWLCERQFMLRPDGRWCASRRSGSRAAVVAVDDLRPRRGAPLGPRLDLPLSPMCDLPQPLRAGSLHLLGVRAIVAVLWGERGFACRGRSSRARKPGGGTRGPVFGFVGGPSRLKGWPLVHDAFARLDREDFRASSSRAPRNGSCCGPKTARRAGGGMVGASALRQGPHG